jgi:hypothetical protein
MKRPEPVEPHCPAGRKPHRDRVKEIDGMLREGMTAAVAIDDTEEHKAWYLHEIAKYKRLSVIFQGRLGEGVYVIKVRKGPPVN